MAVLGHLLLSTVIFGQVVNWSNGQAPNDFSGLIIGLILVLVFVAILVRLSYGVVYGPLPRRHHGRRYLDEPWGGDAEDILDKRYAYGEITQEQYMRMKGDLERNGSGPRP